MACHKGIFKEYTAIAAWPPPPPLLHNVEQQTHWTEILLLFQFDRHFHIYFRKSTRGCASFLLPTRMAWPGLAWPGCSTISHLYIWKNGSWIYGTVQFNRPAMAPIHLVARVRRVPHTSRRRLHSRWEYTSTQCPRVSLIGNKSEFEIYYAY